RDPGARRAAARREGARDPDRSRRGPRRRGPGRRRPAGRGRRPGDPQLRAEPGQGAEGRSAAERRPVDRAREPVLPPRAGVAGGPRATLGPPAAGTLEAWGDLERARAALARGAARVRLEGLWGSAASLALAALLAPDRPALVAVADEPTALRILDDLR